MPGTRRGAIPMAARLGFAPRLPAFAVRGDLHFNAVDGNQSRRRTRAWLR